LSEEKVLEYYNAILIHLLHSNFVEYLASFMGITTILLTYNYVLECYKLVLNILCMT